MSAIPSLGDSVNAVLDAFRKLDREWSALGTVEAQDLFGLRYRWSSQASGESLGVSMDYGWTIRKANAREYDALEQALANGAVQITLYNRVTRQTRVVHQATGIPMPMDCPCRETSAQEQMEPRRFTAYKVYTENGGQWRDGHIRALTLEEARDPVRFPLGPQRDEQGAYVWAYGLNNGQLT